MPDVIPDDAPYEIACPKCGKKIAKTIGWFKGKNLACPFYGARFNMGDFGRGVDEANKKISDAWRQLKDRLGKLR